MPASSHAPLADVQSSCPMCDNPDAWSLTKRDRHGEPLHVVMCSRCTLVRVDPLPSAQEEEAYYTEDYRADYKGSSSPQIKHIWREFSVAQKRMAQLKPYLQPNSKVVDIGSSLGGVVQTLRTRGFEATGVEPYRDYYEFSQRAWNIEVANCVFTKYEAPAPIDLATLFHVVEHVVNLHEVLTHLKTQMAPDGKIFVEVPNILHTGASPRGRYHKAHVLGYSTFTLRMAFEKAGFRVLECSTNSNGENVWLAAQNTQNAPEPELRHPNPQSVFEGLHNHSEIRHWLSLRWSRRMARRIAWQGRERRLIASAKTENDAIELVKNRLLASS